MDIIYLESNYKNDNGKKEFFNSSLYLCDGDYEFQINDFIHKYQEYKKAGYRRIEKGIISKKDGIINFFVTMIKIDKEIEENVEKFNEGKMDVIEFAEFVFQKRGKHPEMQGFENLKPQKMEEFMGLSNLIDNFENYAYIYKNISTLESEEALELEDFDELLFYTVKYKYDEYVQKIKHLINKQARKWYQNL